MRLFPLLFLLAAPSRAADPAEVWHTLEPSARFGRMQLAAHVQFRWRSYSANQDLARVSYFRAGPVVQVALRNFTVAGGYWYQENHGRRGADWEDNDRVFAGAERDLTRSLRTRGTWEYFFGNSRAAFHRYRHLLRFSKDRDGWSPLGSCEIFFDRAGAAALRPLASLRHNLGTQARFEAGYFYDFRRRDAGGPRHVIFTSLRFQLHP